MITRITLCLISLLFLSALPLGATSLIGGEIQFRQTGARELEASVILFYNNATSELIGSDSVYFCWGDGQCELLGLSNGMDVNGDGAPDGEFIAPGVQKNIYTGIHEYVAYGTYRLGMRHSNRPGGIINLGFPNSDQARFYIEALAVLSEDAPSDNHSPVLLEAPVGIGVVGKPFVHIPNAFDIDDDSIAYEWTVPLIDKDTPAPGYIWPDLIPGGDPLNNLAIDPVTGATAWNSPQRPGRYTMAIKISSYRNGELRDQITRDILIEVEDGNNLPANLSLSVEEPGIIDVAVGDTVLVDAAAEDPETGQQLSLSASCGLFEDYYAFPASFSAMASGNQANGGFMWVVRQEHVRKQPYPLVFRAQDDFLLRGLSAMKLLRYRVASAVAADEAGVRQGKRVEVFPNPASGAAQVRIHNLILPARYQLYHGSGQLAGAGQFRQEQEELDLSGLPAGMYFLRVGDANEGEAVKVIHR